MNIWEEPWISDLPDFKLPSTNIREETRDWKVENLIEEGTWNLGELDVSDEVKAAISSLTLPVVNKNDFLIWIRHKGGRYTTKHAYHWLQQEGSVNLSDIPSSSTLPNNQIWSMIWKLKVQPKIKHFL